MAACAVIIFLSLSCSTKPDTPETVLMRYLHEDSPLKLEKYITRDSQKMLSELREKTGVDSPLSLITAHHSPDAEFRVIEEKTDSASSRIQLQCVEHPNENARGFTVSYVLVNKSGNWKVDLTGELQHVLSK